MTNDTLLVRGSRVGIIGGSIAGCATAIALEQLGCDVQVFERSSGVLRDRGSGIAIPITLRDELIDVGYLPAGYAHCLVSHRWWLLADGTPSGRLPGPSLRPPRTTTGVSCGGRCAPAWPTPGTTTA